MNEKSKITNIYYTVSESYLSLGDGSRHTIGYKKSTSLNELKSLYPKSKFPTLSFGFEVERKEIEATVLPTKLEYNKPLYSYRIFEQVHCDLSCIGRESFYENKLKSCVEHGVSTKDTINNRISKYPCNQYQINDFMTGHDEYTYKNYTIEIDTVSDYNILFAEYGDYKYDHLLPLDKITQFSIPRDLNSTKNFLLKLDGIKGEINYKLEHFEFIPACFIKDKVNQAIANCSKHTGFIEPRYWEEYMDEISEYFKKNYNCELISTIQTDCETTRKYKIRKFRYSTKDKFHDFLEKNKEKFIKVQIGDEERIYRYIIGAVCKIK